MMASSGVPDCALSLANPQCVLIVEDEVLIRMVIAEELRDAGYEVVEACDGEEALALLRCPVHIDLILSDVRMPGPVDGLALLSIVQTERPALPFILMSGHLEPQLATSAGAVRFLPKPFMLNVASDAVREALENAI